MLAMLELNTVHNTLYDSTLRHARNCIDEPKAKSMIELPNRSMLLSDRALDTIYCGYADTNHAVSRVLGIRSPKSGVARSDQPI